MKTPIIFSLTAAIFLLTMLTGPYAETLEEDVKDNTSYTLAQMDEYIPCYKDKDGKTVVFRRCRRTSPWTPTNEMRNFCYSTAEDCAKAEMPQSWCIKCGEK
jgi:hypothetical protein